MFGNFNYLFLNYIVIVSKNFVCNVIKTTVKANSDYWRMNSTSDFVQQSFIMDQNNLNLQKSTKTFECETCLNKFTKKHSLTRHFQTIHQHLSSSFECKICLKTFTRKAALTNHVLMVHDKLKPHHCNSCSKPFLKKTG